jgi:hypothetical protein
VKGCATRQPGRWPCTAGLNGVAPELPDRLEAALTLAGKGIVTPEELVQALGEGWVAEEALAVALYAVLATAPGSRSGGTSAALP